MEDMDNMENTVSTEPNKDPKLRGYKVVCAKLGLSMCVYFTCRLLSGRTAKLLEAVSGQIDPALLYLIHSLIVVILVYVVPLLVTMFIFKSNIAYKGNYRELYKKPRRLARALGTFPGMFGLGYGIALLTLLAAFLISRFTDGQTMIEDLLRPTAIEPTTDMLSILTLVILLVVIAPVFEEFWVRGIMYDALKPYGTGMAILISSILFGLMHGSLYMLFYTTAFGFALGYIRYATGSLFTVTILHAIVNSISAMTLFLSALVQITDEENRIINTVNVVYLVAVLILIIVGVVVFISKIPAIRKYKIENSWTEIGPWKKTAWFFVSVPVIIMLVLAFNEITKNWLLDLFL